MTGNEHFKAAEDLIGGLSADGGTFDANCLAEAQVHAMLALVWAVNRMQTDAHGLQQYMADLIVERTESAPCM